MPCRFWLRNISFFPCIYLKKRQIYRTGIIFIIIFKQKYGNCAIFYLLLCLIICNPWNCILCTKIFIALAIYHNFTKRAIKQKLDIRSFYFVGLACNKGWWHKKGMLRIYTIIFWKLIKIFNQNIQLFKYIGYRALNSEYDTIGERSNRFTRAYIVLQSESNQHLHCAQFKWIILRDLPCDRCIPTLMLFPSSKCMLGF